MLKINQLLFLATIIWQFLIVKMYDNPYDNDLSILHLIRNQGYPVELHSNITTEDDYLLDLQRIPYGKDQGKQLKNRPPILLMPSLSASGEIYVLMNESISFLLADAGFDVWIGNPRGSMYSCKHLYLDVSFNSSYWLFSWHEKGYYDLPAFIDYILVQTGYKQIYLLGYSEGTTDISVLCSDRPDYNKKIKAAAFLAPSVFLGHISYKIVKTLASNIDFFRSLLMSAGIKGIHVSSNLVYNIKKADFTSSSTREVCKTILKLVKYDEKIYGTTPCQTLAIGFHGISANEVAHYAQTINEGEFRHFNYGPELNKIKYGAEIAPFYNLKNVVIPIGIFYSVDDVFTTAKDISKLMNNLPNIKYVKRIEGFNVQHIHFMVRRNFKEILFENVINFLKKDF